MQYEQALSLSLTSKAKNPWFFILEAPISTHSGNNLWGYDEDGDD